MIDQLWTVDIVEIRKITVMSNTGLFGKINKKKSHISRFG